MQVISIRPGFALVAGHGERREVNTALVGEPAPGDWLLVFIDAARELIDAQRAQEINTTLDLLQDAMAHDANDPAHPGFDLPSAMSAESLAALSAQH
jgi:hydrogenase expression/formation protein HypC